MAAVVALAVLLSGCSGTHSSTGGQTASPSAASPSAVSASDAPSETDAGRPEVGDCWFEKNYTKVAKWRFWEGGVARDCTTKHNSITYQVRDLPPVFDTLPWPRGDTDDLPSRYTQAILKTCDFKGLSRYSGADLSRITGAWYLPSKQQWSQGERWIRCDLLVRRIGSHYSPLVPEVLPATLAEVGARPEEDYTLCMLGTPPLSPDSIVVKCGNTTSDWRLFASYHYPSGPTVPFPGSATIAKKAESLCKYSNPDVVVSVYTPSEKYWSSFRAIYCFAAT